MDLFKRSVYIHTNFVNENLVYREIYREIWGSPLIIIHHFYTPLLEYVFVLFQFPSTKYQGNISTLSLSKFSNNMKL